MEKIWHYTFYNKHYLNYYLDPTEHPVVMTESILNNKANREKMAQVMFETFNVPFYYSNSQEFYSLLSNEIDEGLVCIMGYDSYQSVAFYYGISIPISLNTVNLSGNIISSYLCEILNDRGYTFATSKEKEIVNDIRYKLAYVVYDYNSNLQIAKSSSELDKNYTLPDGYEIILADELFRCTELLFQPNMNKLEYKGIDKTIVNSISKCDPDIQSMLFSNICLSGGSSMLKGLPERLYKEINHLAPKGKEVRVLARPERKKAAFYDKI